MYRFPDHFYRTVLIIDQRVGLLFGKERNRFTKNKKKNMKTLSKILFIFQKQNTHKSKINYINKFDYQSVQYYDIGKGNTCKKFDFHLSFF